MKKFLFSFFSMILLTGLFAQTTDEQIRQAANSLGVPFDDLRQFVRTHQRTDASYRIGDRGPAGGIIFYDNGNDTGGWRYLEAAPIEAEATAKWGAYEKTVGGTATAIGMGRRNTELIADMLDYLGEARCAAQICENLVYGGYDDWFLPSKDELNLMYENLKLRGLGRLYGVWYWSSSEGNQHDAYRQHFIDGSWPIFVGHFNKRVDGSVRAIRQF
jgi:hypothetical protein